MAYAPDPLNMPKLGSIATKLSTAQIVPQQFKRPPKILAQLSTGELYLDSELQLDTDGWISGPGQAEPTHQAHTSLRYKGGASLDANGLAFFVLPLPAVWPAEFGIQVGDYAAVLYKGRLTFAVFGDQGPKDKIGEGSIKLFRQLGQERIRADGSVWDTGMGPGIITIVFPGSGNGQKHFADQAALGEHMNAVGPQRFAAAGGVPQ